MELPNLAHNIRDLTLNTPNFVKARLRTARVSVLASFDKSKYDADPILQK
jgi:hypothetical protein